MYKNLKRFLPIYIILLFIICCLGLVGIFFHAYFNYDGSNSTQPVLQVALANEDKTTYHKVLANGQMTKSKHFSVKNEEIIDVDPAVFKDKTVNNSIHLKLGKYTLRDQNKRKVVDPVYKQMMQQVAHEQKHLIGVFKMFKVNNHYYAFLKLNAGLDDNGIIYRYSYKDKKMKQIAETKDDDVVLAVKNIER